MYLKRLTLKSFRNYQKITVDFAQGFNFIIGLNGVGKTNLLDAVMILSTIKSFRNIRDKDLAKIGSDFYYCKAEIEDEEYNTFEIGCSVKNKIKKKARINDIEIKKSAEYFGKLLVVIFSPDDLLLITGEPSRRRKYFDGVIAKADIQYYKELQEYKKILKSRNSLLKNYKESHKINFKHLDLWDQMLAEKAEIITKKRYRFIKDFNYYFSSAYQKITEVEDELIIVYHSSLNLDKKEILEKLKENRRRDLLTGTTNVGPQRDDYLFKINNLQFNDYGSQGQKRSAAISLKKSEADFLKKVSGKEQILLIDDIFSELDLQKRKNLVEVIKKYQQIIFTMVNDYLIKELGLQEYNLLKIENNVVSSNEF